MDTPTYTQLFTDLAIYRLPDGTGAQAIWTGRAPREAGTPPDCWILIPCDNPDDHNAWHQQYEVRPDGTIVRTRYIGEHAPAPLGALPKATFQTEGVTDLTIDDFELVSAPFA